MCGLAGIVSTDGLEPSDHVRVLGMRDSMRHRGPDAAGLVFDDCAVLGHRRLSIVDLSGGAQPMSNDDRTIWVAFNGEIYNHADLRRDLEHAGHVYRTRSDTETIVHGYEQWGDDCVSRFRGMFAFALWDARRRRLLLARDRLGVKPLYWARHGSRLLFASEIKAILSSGLVCAHVNEPALPQLLGTRAVAGEETLFRGIWTLMPGHQLALADGRVTVRRYWDIPTRAEHGTRHGAADHADDARTLRRLLEESIRLRLMSDVPLGVFLSGGLDSSAIAALAAPMVGRSLDVFSVAFADRACSELRYSREVAAAIGARTHEVVIDDRDFFAALPRLVWHEDEPIAHPSSVPLYAVSALARRTVKVVLTGEGSDELLAGYGRYPRSLVNWRLGGAYERAVPHRLRRLVSRAVHRLPHAARRQLSRTFLGTERSPDLIFFDAFAAVSLERQRDLLAPRLAALVSRRRAYRTLVTEFDAPGSDRHVLDRLLYADMKTYLVELLMKQDRMSMASSIESRVPFLDHVLVEFAARLPARRKLAGWTTKRVLRDAVKDVVPRAVIDRPKMGFPVPFHRWMREGWNDIVRGVLMDRCSLDRGVLSATGVARLLDDARAGAGGAADAVWALLNLELWYRTFIDGAGVQTLETPATRARPAFASTTAVAAQG
jgi:asparagine synthase (glutamine-hydrolysing)